MAEREGFEPSISLWDIPDFESGSFDHSDTSPPRLIALTTRSRLRRSLGSARCLRFASLSLRKADNEGLVSPPHPNRLPTSQQAMRWAAYVFSFLVCGSGRGESLPGERSDFSSELVAQSLVEHPESATGSEARTRDVHLQSELVAGEQAGERREAFTDHGRR